MKMTAPLIAAALLISGCGDADSFSLDGPQLTKDEIRLMDFADSGKPGFKNGEDICLKYGYYGDGECDEFCYKPDPDCPQPEPPDDSPFQDSAWSWSSVEVTDVASPHDYPANMDQIWELHREGTTRIRLHFSLIATERDFDYVTVYNNVDPPLYLHGLHQDLWTPEFSGDSLYVAFHTDETTNGWGFEVDRLGFYEQLPPGFCNRDEDCQADYRCQPDQLQKPDGVVYGKCRHMHCYASFTNDTDLRIPDGNSVGVYSSIEVFGLPYCQQRLFVEVEIDHDWRSDISIDLWRPDDQLINLWNKGVTASGDEIHRSGGVLRSRMLVTDDLYDLANGTWYLQVRDVSSIASGSLKSWTLSFE